MRIMLPFEEFDLTTPCTEAQVEDLRITLNEVFRSWLVKHEMTLLPIYDRTVLYGPREL